MTGAAIAYVPMHKRAILPGNPLCADNQIEDVVRAFLVWLKKNTHLKPIFILVGKTVESVMAEKYGWKSFTNIAEQRVNLGSREHLELNTDVQKKIRHAQKKGVKVTNYGNEVPADVKEKCNEAIEQWQHSRSGEQVHLSEVTPWVDSEHRQYFIAEGSDGETQALVVLAELSPKYGIQVKWALDFPVAENGIIEFAIESALKVAAKSNKSCSFGAGATSDLSGGLNMGMAKATGLNSVYQAFAAKFGVDRKSGFRAKFNTSEEALYICYPRRGMGQNGIRAIVDFFRD